jgi:heme A synthase
LPAAYIALALLLLQITLGAITVRLSLPPWTVILHLGTAMLLLGVLLAAARPGPLAWPPPEASVAAILGFVTVLLGALTANLGAATACIGFPLCNGRLVPAGDALQGIHWAHRLLAYTLTAYVTVWALRTQRRGPLTLLGLVALQVTIAAMMVLWALPGPLQAAHVAVGTALWAGLVLVALSPASEPA